MNDINNYNDTNYRYTNNGIIDLKRTINGNRAYSTNTNSTNYYDRNERVPRIVRNKKNVNKFINNNNKNSNLREITKENNIQQLYRPSNNIKRNRSIDRNSFYNENKKYNKLNSTNVNFNNRLNKSIDYEIRNENRNQKINKETIKSEKLPQGQKSTTVISRKYQSNVSPKGTSSKFNTRKIKSYYNSLPFIIYKVRRNKLQLYFIFK